MGAGHRSRRLGSPGDRGTANSDSLDLVAASLAVGAGGVLYVGGEFTDAGGVANADRIAKWNGSSWSAVSSASSQISTAASPRSRSMTARSTPAGRSRTPGATQTPTTSRCGTVRAGAVLRPRPRRRSGTSGPAGRRADALRRGEFLNAAHDPTPTPSSPAIWSRAARARPDPKKFSGPVYALTADSDGTLYAGGGFTNLEDDDAADNVAYLPRAAAWQPMGTGASGCGGCAVNDFVRGLTAVGTDVYIGTERTTSRASPRPTTSQSGTGRAGCRGREQRRHDRVVPDAGDLDQRSVQRRHQDLRHRHVPGRERRRARRPRRVVRRDRLAPARLRRRREWPVERQRPRAGRHRWPALRGRELHQRRRRPPGALGRLVRSRRSSRSPRPR